MKAALEKVATAASTERYEEDDPSFVPEVTLRLIADLRQGILGSLSYERRSAATIAIALGLTEEESA